MQGNTQQEAIAKTLNFQQAGEFYRSLSAQDEADLIRNLSGDLAKVRNVETRDIMLSHFYKAPPIRRASGQGLEGGGEGD